jgi:hypothetical protein
MKGSTVTYLLTHNTVYPHRLALTSPTSGGRSVGIVRLRTMATEFSLISNQAWSTEHQWDSISLNVEECLWRKCFARCQFYRVYLFWKLSEHSCSAAVLIHNLTVIQWRHCLQIFTETTHVSKSVYGEEMRLLRPVQPDFLNKQLKL